MFWALALGIFLFGVSVLAARRVVRAVLALLGCVVCIAFLFFLLGADAAGSAQLMVYAGGVMVLLIFGVMASTELSATRGPLSKPIEVVSGLFLSILLFAGLTRLLLPALHGFAGLSSLEVYKGGSLQGAGQELITYQAAPFEWAALLLLLALAFAAPLTFRAGEGSWSRRKDDTAKP